MTDDTRPLLEKLEGLIRDARAVPMSASCMVNRSEALDLIAKAKEALASDTSGAARVAATSLETIQRAQEQAEQIVKAAEDKADYLVSQTQVMAAARQKAATLESSSIRAAEDLQRETDIFVDQRIALFEANLQKTQTQVATMRARLAKRSHLDDTDTQALPRLAL